MGPAALSNPTPWSSSPGDTGDHEPAIEDRLPRLPGAFGLVASPNSRVGRCGSYCDDGRHDRLHRLRDVPAVLPPLVISKVARFGQPGYRWDQSRPT
jgi:hypothetical protein